MSVKTFNQVLSQIFSLIRRFVYLIAPLLTLSLFLLICAQNNLYPLGEKSLAWCDANQQVIPLLADFKDILEGRQGFFINLANAGGANFFGIFFFFLCSPFSFLVIFVSKAELMLFFNVLMLLKLMTISFTSSWYLGRKYHNLNVGIILGLSMLYTFSAYTMMYYQNLMWLDIVYLLPLLLGAIDYLFEKDKYLPYMITIILIFVFNYYLGAMVVIFTLLYVGLRLYDERKIYDTKRIALTFIKGSALAALIAAFIYIPVFIQYLSSARSASLITSIQKSWFISSYQTTIPIFLCLVSILPFMFIKNEKNRVRIILFILTLIPCVIEPINKMWHFGSYQAFPCRFAFITIMLGIEIVASNLDLFFEDQKSSLKGIIGDILVILIAIGAIFFQIKFVEEKIGYLDQYASTLWGNDTSFEAILRYYSVILLLVLIIFGILKTKKINKTGFSISLLGLLLVEATFSLSIYAIPPSRDTSSYQNYFELSDKIQDESFYRVKTTNKMMDVNLLGAIGYNSIGHYTSLTDETYMFTMKKLGYSSYWMEVGTYGGTKFTDALLINKYTIKSGVQNDAYLNTEHFSIYQNQVLPFGIPTYSDLSAEEELEPNTRAMMQNHIYEKLFGGESLHNFYDYEVHAIQDDSTEEYFRLKPLSTNSYLQYNVEVNEPETLYFECFDQYSNNLSEPINESLKIYVNDKLISNSYPTQNMNGTIELGTFENTIVHVQIKLSKTLNCRSLSLYSIKDQLFDQVISNTKGADLKVSGDRIYGSFDNMQNANYLFIALPYNTGYHAKINGQNASLVRVFSGFMALKLNEGQNDIELTFYAQGMTPGIIITCLGLILLSADLLVKYRYKLTIPHRDTLERISFVTCIVLLVLTIVILYLFPILLNVAKELSLFV